MFLGSDRFPLKLSQTLDPSLRPATSPSSFTIGRWGEGGHYCANNNGSRATRVKRELHTFPLNAHPQIAPFSYTYSQWLHLDPSLLQATFLSCSERKSESEQEGSIPSHQWLRPFEGVQFRIDNLASHFIRVQILQIDCLTLPLIFFHIQMIQIYFEGTK